MREILFRGKTIYNDKWVKGFLVPMTIGGCNKCYEIIDTDGIDYDDYDYYCPHYNSNRVIPETIGQYTGLTDKNGTKIFEGDKCRVTRHCILCYGSITFKKGSFWFEEFNTNSVLELSKLEINNFEIEIIGNIHDNPELLGGD